MFVAKDEGITQPGEEREKEKGEVKRGGGK
jgi:hypothetical protein